METGERVDARRTEGRAILLRAAIRCMVERGYYGTSIRDIAREAGMTSAALYHHFASKQAILVEIMRQALDEAYAATTAASAASEAANWRERLEAMTHAWVLFHCVQRDAAMLGASEIRSLDEQHRSSVIELRDRQELAFRSVVEGGVSAGEFEVSDPAMAARAILTSGTAVATWFDPHGRNTAEEVARTYKGFAGSIARSG